MVEGTGSHLRTFAHAVPVLSSAVCPARPCFLLTHIPTRLPSVPRSQPPCNFLRYPIIYSFILFMSALPPPPAARPPCMHLAARGLSVELVTWVLESWVGVV